MSYTRYIRFYAKSIYSTNRDTNHFLLLLFFHFVVGSFDLCWTNIKHRYACSLRCKAKQNSGNIRRDTQKFSDSRKSSANPIPCGVQNCATAACVIYMILASCYAYGCCYWLLLLAAAFANWMVFCLFKINHSCMHFSDGEWDAMKFNYFDRFFFRRFFFGIELR